MGDAYTPGLTVTARTVVRKTRRLPLTGTVLAKMGERVKANDVVARTELPGKVTMMNVANLLGVMPDEIDPRLVVKPGGAIKKGQLFAAKRSFLRVFDSNVVSPIDGTFESISKVTGQAMLREPPVPVEVKAYIDGVVVEIIPDEGVVIEAEAALIQGIFGLSGEVHATLRVVGKTPEAVLDAADVKDEHKGLIIIGGGLATLAAMRKAIAVGVAGVVVGVFSYQDVRELLGYDVGVAVTGTEALGTTLVLTEGFGGISMAAATYELLARHQGRAASISGATQIRAGVIRPEVIIADPIEASAAEDDQVPGFEVGAPVRCIRAPHFGRIGVVSALPIELQQMPSETMVRVVEVTIDGGKVVIPRANVEVIER
jgi:hypothetical protein